MTKMYEIKANVVNVVYKASRCMHNTLSLLINHEGQYSLMSPNKNNEPLSISARIVKKEVYSPFMLLAMCRSMDIITIGP